MKRFTGYALLILVLSSILVFDSCKRGENDPFFSFRSRKARVTGDWTFENMERNVTQLFSQPGSYKAIVNFKLDGDNITIKVDSINTPHDTSKTTRGIIKEAFYRFDKNSKMEYVFHYETTWEKTTVDENTNVTTYERIVTTVKDRATGSWNFLSGVEDNGVNKFKNKERISLIFETYNENVTVVWSIKVTDEEGVVTFTDYNSTSNSQENKYANGENAQMWVLDELRNKKIVMSRNIDNLIVTDDNGVGYSYQEKGTENATLKPRQ